MRIYCYAVNHGIELSPLDVVDHYLTCPECAVKFTEYHAKNHIVHLTGVKQ